MDDLFKTKMMRCRHYFGNLKSATEIECTCRKQDYKVIEEKECETCPMFKSIFIEYPITVSKIEQHPIDYQDGLYAAKVGKPVKVRVNDKTYLGIFLGELPTAAHITHSEADNVLTVGHQTNPAMFVPELNRIVFGYESWWSVMESPEDLKQITDDDIQNVWYVQLMQSLYKQEGETN